MALLAVAMVDRGMVGGRLDVCDVVGTLRPDYWPRLVIIVRTVLSPSLLPL